MNDKKTAASSGGSGWGIATAGIAIVVAAGGYLIYQNMAGPTDEELTAMVPEVSSQPISEAELAPAPSDSVASQEAPAPVAEETQENKPPDTVQEAERSEDAQSEAAAPKAPSIDELRVGNDGMAVVAGRAEPGASVDVVVDGSVVATAQADASGAFAAIGFVEASDSARVLSLRADIEGTLVESVDEVIIAPIAEPPAVVAQAPEADAVSEPANNDAPETQEKVAQNDAPETQEDVTQASQETESAQTQSTKTAQETVDATVAQSDGVEEETVTVAEVETPEPAAQNTRTAENTETALDTGAAPEQTDALAEAEEPEAVAQSSSAAALVPAGDDSAAAQLAKTAPAATSQVSELPTPAPATPAEAPQIALLKSDEQGVTLLQTSPVPPSQLQLDTIGYSDSGAVQLAGRASAEAVEVRVYLNNRAVVTLPVLAAGNWRGEVPNVEAGVYTLRVDAVDAAGDVANRIETPFKREAPAVLAAASASATGPATAVTVQQGDTLWAIARERYGEGLLFVQVFEANRAFIRDPNLIYPGQIFTLPED